MNARTMTLLIAGAVAATLSTRGNEEQENFPKREERALEMREKLMMRRFDKDGDGKLDDAEKAEMEKHKKEILAKYDKDGDGQLGPEERKAFMDDRRKEMGAPGGPGMPGGPGGPGGENHPRLTPEERRKIMEKFDKDGDGKLNEEERKAAFEAHRERIGKERGERRGPGEGERAMMLEKFDADGDGKLNEAERAKMREEMRKRMQKRDGGAE
jgi:Ca2+-binding EF-hand superfamily protein